MGELYWSWRNRREIILGLGGHKEDCTGLGGTEGGGGELYRPGIGILYWSWRIDRDCTGLGVTKGDCNGLGVTKGDCTGLGVTNKDCTGLGGTEGGLY